MESLRDFISMGGYAAYVWPAYIFAAAILAGMIVSSWQSARRREAELAALRQARRGEGDET
jgi:heme exporter protein D